MVGNWKHEKLLQAVCLVFTVSAVQPLWARTTESAPEAQRDNSRPRLEHVVVSADRLTDALALEEVVRTGSRLDLPARDLPASVSVVTQELIQLRGARTAMEAIHSAVGMTGGTGVGSIPNYSTRGFTGNDITVMRDGIRQNTSSQASRPLDSFLFDRVEVLKGPASLLYGEGAVGGAVNYVSKQPGETFGGEMQVGIGSWDGYRIGLGAGGPTAIEGVSFRADISLNDTGGYVDASDSRYEAYAGSLFWALSERTRITLTGTYLADDILSYYGTPLVYDAVVDQNGAQAVRKAASATDSLVGARIASGTRRLNYNIRNNHSDAENSFWRVIVDSELGPGFSLRNELYYAAQRLDWRNIESTVWNPVTQLVDRGSFFLIYRDDEQIGNRLDLTWQGTLFGRPNQFLAGLLIERNDQLRNGGQDNPTTTVPATVPLTGFERGYGPFVRGVKTSKVITDTQAFYVENVFEASNALKLVGGLRYDRIDVDRHSYLGQADFEKSYRPLTGRFGVVYAVTPAVNVYASYSRAAQPVTQLVGLNASHDDYSLQKGVQYEIGTKASFWEERGSLTVALFDIEKNDLLTSQVVDGTRFNSQIGAQVSQGVEVALSVALAPELRIDLNYARTWKAEFEEFHENLGTGVISRGGNTPPNVPKTVAGLHLVKGFGNWQITAGVRHVGEREANNNNGIQLDSYTTVDASIGHQWRNLTVTLWGRNLTDEAYAEWASAGGLTQRLADPASAELVMRYRF